MCTSCAIIHYSYSAHAVIAEDNGTVKWEGGVGLWIIFLECMLFILFQPWGGFASCIIIHQVLSSFLLSISPACHLFTLPAFRVPMGPCDCPFSLLSFPLVSPLFQTILHLGWLDGHIQPCHSLLSILLYLLIASRTRSRFLSSTYKALHSDSMLLLWLPILPCLYMQTKSQHRGATCGSLSCHALSHFLAFVPAILSA